VTGVELSDGFRGKQINRKRKRERERRTMNARERML
jgi:hypothetical protein